MTAMNKPRPPCLQRQQPWRNPRPRSTAALLALTLCITLLGLYLSGCKSTETRRTVVDQTDERTAVQTESPDTIRVDSLRVDTVWMPGATITWPETVKVAKEKPTKKDTADAFPLQELSVDSSNVRLTGLSKEFSVPHPCFGETLIARSFQNGVSFRVTGDCVPRDTIIKTKIQRQSWVDRKIDAAARWLSVVAIGLILVYLLRRTLGTAIRAALPW